MEIEPARLAEAAGDGKSEYEPSVAFFESVTDQHRNNGEKTERSEAIHLYARLGGPTRQ